MNSFHAACLLLQKLRTQEGELVAFAWDGEKFKASIARPQSGKKMVVATFDGPGDFDRQEPDIIAEIRAMADKRFQ